MEKGGDLGRSADDESGRRQETPFPNMQAKAMRHEDGGGYDGHNRGSGASGSGAGVAGGGEGDLHAAHMP